MALTRNIALSMCGELPGEAKVSIQGRPLANAQDRTGWRIAAAGIADIDEIRDAVSNSIEPHGLTCLDRRSGLDANNAFGEIGALRMVRLGYGADVVVDRQLDRDENGVLVEMVSSGHSTITCGRESVVSTTDVAAVLSPHLPTQIHYSHDCEKRVLRIDRHRLQQHCQALTGRTLKAPPEFSVRLDLASPLGSDWLRLMNMATGAISDGSPLTTSRLAAVQFEQFVMTTLLLMQENRYSELLRDEASPAAPGYVKRAEAYMDANLDEPLTIVDVASYVGVSVRSLQASFQRFRGVSPLTFIRDLRLARVREDLERADPETCRVTDVAIRWGFTHLGKFAQVYRARYAEAPSLTLKRRL